MINLSFFSECELCFAPTNLSGFLCQSCYDELPKAAHSCLYCGEPLRQSKICHRCLLKPPPTDYLYCNYLYRPPLSQWIKAFKDNHQLLHLPRLLWLMAEHPPTLEYIDAITYIPSEGVKFLRRGFNPAELMARALAKKYKLEVLRNALIKNTAQDQRLLRRAQRIKNSQESIKPGRLNLTGQKILLIEDVVTTGATANAAADALKAQGADFVQVWALARTPSHFKPKAASE